MLTGNSSLSFISNYHNEILHNLSLGTELGKGESSFPTYSILSFTVAFSAKKQAFKVAYYEPRNGDGKKLISLVVSFNSL